LSTLNTLIPIKSDFWHCVTPPRKEQSDIVEDLHVKSSERVRELQSFFFEFFRNFAQQFSFCDNAALGQALVVF